MANKTLGREELRRIKIIVKASASRKRAAFRERARHNTDPSSMELPQTPWIGKQELHIASQNNAKESLIEQSLQRSPPVQPPKSLGDNIEANLMMHYLDNVFYIQFRFFTPSISTGARGWLLSLLNRTKPLYHAALSLSAFHRQSLLQQIQTGQAQTDYLHELERHYKLTLEELQLFIQAHRENTSSVEAFGGNIQILACMVQLISFEVCQIVLLLSSVKIH